MATLCSTITLCSIASAIVLNAGIALSAPKVVKVDKSHYSGTWLEIGRRPMFITDGCVAGYTTYRAGADAGEILVEDGCREGTPNGKLKTVKGRGVLIDAGAENATLRVRYPLLITFTYRVIYKSPDKTWFISADKAMTNLWIYSRKVPSKSRLKMMIAKAGELGYDVERLEFPAQ